MGGRAMWILTAGLVDFEIFRCLSSGAVQAALDDEVTAVEGAVVIGTVLRKLTNVCHGSWRSIRSKPHPNDAELRVYRERHSGNPRGDGAKTTLGRTCRTMRGKRSVGPLAEGESGSLSTKHVDEALSLWWHVDEQAWYESTLLHWKTAVSAESDDGVLGGYGSIDSVDTEGSLEFLSTNRQFASWHSGGSLPLPGTRALDCGAGVGRVSEGVLLKVCETVQLVEVPQP